MGKQIDDQNGLTQPLPRRWTRRHAKGVLAAWRESGLSMAAYARERGVSGQRLSWWRKQVGDAPKASGAITFIPGVVKGHGEAVLVRLPGGVEIETMDVKSVPACWVAEVVAALEQPK